MCVFQPSLCPQCGAHSAHFDYDVRTGGYQIDCARCGHHQRYDPNFDEEGSYSGYTHTVTKGAGVLWFRYAGEPAIYCHSLHTPEEVDASERWLHEGLDNGTVEAGTAFLTRWNDETQQVECVVGELLSFLAGKVVRRSGVPGDAEQGNRGDLRKTKGTLQ